MSIHTQIKEEIKNAMRAKDEVKKDTLRGLASLIQSEMMAKGVTDETASDDFVITLVKRLVKQRKDSIEQFKAGGRPELAEKEEAELAVLGVYLPATMSREEIKRIAEETVSKLGLTVDKSGLGKLTGVLMKELKGRADGADVKAVLDEMVK